MDACARWLADRSAADRPVSLGLTEGLKPGDAVHAAAAVRAAGRVVETSNGGSIVGVTRRWAQMEQLIQRNLSVKDVASDHAQILLYVVGAENLAIDHSALEIRRQLRVAIDHAIRVSLEILSVRRLTPLVRNILREHREEVDAVRRKSGIERTRDTSIGVRRRRTAAVHVCVLECALDMAR